MRFAETPLERELAGLPTEDQAKRRTEIWRSFKGTPAFWLMVAVLRNIEEQAVELMRKSKIAPDVPARTLRVIDLIRTTFENYDTMESTEWFDAEAFFGE